MTTKKSTINFSLTKTVITYDLSPCNISVQDICSKDNRFKNTVTIKNVGTFDLPNTTVQTSLSINDAVSAFRTAVANVSKDETITKLFAIDVSQKDGFVENTY